MERDVLALLSRRERRAGRELGAGPKDRELLVDQPKISVALFELTMVGATLRQYGQF